ncbi:MAG: hypothetical protein ACTHLZ_15675 [Tepidisphaeraceae bacterium]
MAIPMKDAQLAPWANNFSTRITAVGNPYQIPDAQGDLMVSRTAAFVTAYNTLMAARSDGTWAESQTAIKDAAKAAVLEIGRELYATIAASTSISDADKILAGVHVRADTHTSVAGPTARPGMELVSVVSRTLTARIFDSASATKRGKPVGAVQAFCYTFVGETYPSDPALWQFQGAFTKGTCEITFPDTVPGGAQVWVCAAWVSRKGETGPASMPIPANIQGGGVGTASSMKIAA